MSAQVTWLSSCFYFQHYIKFECLTRLHLHAKSQETFWISCVFSYVLSANGNKREK